MTQIRDGKYVLPALSVINNENNFLFSTKLLQGVEHFDQKKTIILWRGIQYETLFLKQGNFPFSETSETSINYLCCRFIAFFDKLSNISFSHRKK